MAKSKLVQANEKIAESVVDGYKKIENGVVSGYKKIETGVVEGFTKMTDHFVDQFLTKEGETVAEAKAAWPGSRPSGKNATESRRFLSASGPRRGDSPKENPEGPSGSRGFFSREPRRKQFLNNSVLFYKYDGPILATGGQHDAPVLSRAEEVYTMFQILVVEDDRELNKTVCSYLDQNGYQATGCLDANAAYDAMYGGSLFDLIISDIMLPGIDGFEFAKTVRELNQEIPILFMTARDDFASKQKGFRAGIDDYMVKPIDLDELLLRIQALLRRAKIAASKRLEVGSLVLDADELSATVDGEEIPLTVREFNLLYKLLSYPKKTFTRSQLMEEFWDGDTTSGPRTVDVYITKLRSKFARCEDFEIVTVHGLGYKAVLK